ncbi:MAG: hypothetical protein ACFCU8_05500 [Thermosynechococcaceae cyanobacterium]
MKQSFHGRSRKSRVPEELRVICGLRSQTVNYPSPLPQAHLRE